MPDPGAVEAGLGAVEAQRGPIKLTKESLVTDAVRKDLKEGRVKEALVNLANPGKNIDQATAYNAFSDKFQKDRLDPSGKNIQSAEQRQRMAEGTDMITKLTDYIENGIRAGSTNDLSMNLSEYFMNHRPMVEALTTRLGHPPTQFDMIDVAVRILSNPDLANMLKSNLADILLDQKEGIDYSILLTKQQEQQEKTAKIAEITSEINGVSTELTTVKGEIDDFREIIKPDGTVDRGKYTTQKLDLVSQKGEKESEKSQYNDAIEKLKELKDKFQSGTGGAGVEFYDPRTKSFIKIVDKTDLERWLKIEMPKLEVKSREIKAEITEIDGKTKLIDEREKELKQKRQKNLETQQNNLEEQKKNTEIAKKNLDEEVDRLLKGAGDLEQALVDKLTDLLPDTVTNMWVAASDIAENKSEEVLREYEKGALEVTQRRLRESLWDQNKKRFNENQLKTLVAVLKSAPVGKAAEAFGRRRISDLLTSLPPNSELEPALDSIVSDPEKLKEFSETLTFDLLKITAFKSPKALEKIFSTDERALRALSGDILPSLIMKAKGDTTLQEALGIGPEMTKKTIAEKMKGWDWKKIMKILAVILALGGGVAMFGGIAK